MSCFPDLEYYTRKNRLKIWVIYSVIRGAETFRKRGSKLSSPTDFQVSVEDRALNTLLMEKGVREKWKGTLMADEELFNTGDTSAVDALRSVISRPSSLLAVHTRSTFLCAGQQAPLLICYFLVKYGAHFHHGYSLINWSHNDNCTWHIQSSLSSYSIDFLLG